MSKNLYESRWALAWLKFRRNRMALAAAIILSIMYLMTLFSGFISPYDPDHRFVRRDYLPPWGIHFVGPDGFSFRPFVYGVNKDIDPETGRLIYTVDKERRYPVRFFVRGDTHSTFGIESDLHLFGIESPDGQEGIFLLGTDEQGREDRKSTRLNSSHYS